MKNLILFVLCLISFQIYSQTNILGFNENYENSKKVVLIKLDSDEIKIIYNDSTSKYETLFIEYYDENENLIKPKKVKRYFKRDKIGCVSIVGYDPLNTELSCIVIVDNENNINISVFDFNDEYSDLDYKLKWCIRSSPIKI